MKATTVTGLLDYLEQRLESERRQAVVGAIWSTAMALGDLAAMQPVTAAKQAGESLRLLNVARRRVGGIAWVRWRRWRETGGEL